MNTTPAHARRTTTAALMTAALAVGVAVVPAAAATPSIAAHDAGSGFGRGEKARLSHQESVAVRVTKGVFERGDTKVVDRFVRPDYIAHNPNSANGAEALKNLGVFLHQQFPNARYNVKRVFSEGNLVVMHSNVVMTPGTRGDAVVDIFRFEGGKIAEHWDASQEVPETTASGNDMFSTLSRPQTQEPGSRGLTARNKKLVTAYYDQVLVRKDLSGIDTYVAADYYQHNPDVENGPEGAKAGLGWFFQQFPQLTYTPKRVIAEGDLVAVHSHFVPAPGERGSAVVDIFRVRNGKIVEHWDVIQAVPETSANDNTMF
ncbi:nuclear transport factor 2 family protein [Streptomyces flaveus]|uniref:SnoaL-like domain-containing protein n=1 Tax=Streptomyces flaveus TaxID=66370 RepID=A0A917VJ97_9ACTN|nr:nuclear transport factor 2 family protein [Streptomyces flaveus]GGK85089.1 hypothetical protein GCM10010094_52930 [Streptomyces flaveus]